VTPEEIIDDVELEEIELEKADETPAAPGGEQASAPKTAAFDEMLDASKVPAAPPKTIVCNHCGYNQTSGSKFCDGCGRRIDSPAFLPKVDDSSVDYGPLVRTVMVGDEVWPLCGDCGTANRPGQLVCRQCQAPLRKRELF